MQTNLKKSKSGNSATDFPFTGIQAVIPSVNLTIHPRKEYLYLM